MGGLPGNQVFLAKLQHMEERVVAPEPLWAAMIVNFHQVEEARFDTEGGSDPWEPLSDFTLANKAALGYSGTNILERTGDLWSSMTGTNGFSDTRMSQYGWFSGTTVSYAHFHQEGTAHMPMRAIVNLTPGVVAMWVTMMKNYFFEGGSEGKMPSASSISKAI